MPHDVIMPALGMAQDEGVIVAWLKNEGDAVEIGDALMEVETDKAVMEVEAQASGFLTGVSVPAGGSAPVGGVIAQIAESPNAEPRSAPPAEQKPPAERSTDAPAARQGASPAPTPSEQRSASPPPNDPARSIEPGDRILASPKLKRAAGQAGLDLELLARSGAPQPYHMKDFAELERLAGASRAPAATAAMERIEALAADGLGPYLDWAREELGAPLDRAAVLAAFAAAGLRAGGAEGPIRVAIGGAIYRDPDRAGLSALGPSEESEDADLELIDLSRSRITRIERAGAGAVLAITRASEGFALALSKPSQGFDGIAALEAFAERIEAPVRHVL